MEKNTPFVRTSVRIRAKIKTIPVFSIALVRIKEKI